jgi:hypothetical protein
MANLPPLSEHFPERQRPSLRLEDHVRMFHAECGGIVVGELGQPLTCAECGAEMTAFLSAADEAELARPVHAAIREAFPVAKKGGHPKGCLCDACICAGCGNAKHSGPCSESRRTAFVSAAEETQIARRKPPIAQRTAPEIAQYYRTKPVRVARIFANRRICKLCRRPIEAGQSYYAGGAARLAHVDCVVKLAEENA